SPCPPQQYHIGEEEERATVCMAPFAQEGQSKLDFPGEGLVWVPRRVDMKRQERNQFPAPFLLPPNLGIFELQSSE
ncbi:hypothetical protein STEG23_008693, partial [Scotinomys teguina]